MCHLAARLGNSDVAEQDLVLLQRCAESIDETLLIDAHEELNVLVRYLKERPGDVIVAVPDLGGIKGRVCSQLDTVPLPKLSAIRPPGSLAVELDRRASILPFTPIGAPNVGQRD